MKLPIVQSYAGFAMALALAFMTVPTKATTTDLISEQQKANAQALMEKALKSDLAYEIVESLTTEIGPRLAGSEAEKRARDWGVKLGKELGFDRVSVEEFTMPYWVRGELKVALSAPYAQVLYATALGGSGASSNNIDAPIVYFRNLDEIASVKSGDLAGKVAFIDGDLMVPSQTGAGYSPSNQKRRVGWQHAERGGALALMIRSVGSNSQRFPHTGMMSALEDKWASIPVVALSNPDADQLRRLYKLGEPLKVSIASTAQWKGDVSSGNVILDLIGSERPEEIVLIAGHLDSWDEATGALDDGAGIAITVAAAKLIAELPTRPKRTIRVVMFGAEEVGLLGAFAYAKKHADNLHNHVLATESDFGARTIWRLVSNVNPDANATIDAIGKILEPLGIVRGASDVPGGGPDIIPMARAGVPTIRLEQNGMDYFDYHHTPDDTLDKIIPEELKQNVAAYAVTAYLAADATADFRPEAKTRSEED